MRKEKKERKAKRKEKERKRGKRGKRFLERKGRFSRVSGGRCSKVRGLKLVHAVGSTCGRQKVGVSTNSKRYDIFLLGLFLP